MPTSKVICTLLSKKIEFSLCEVSVTYSEAILCGNTLDQIYLNEYRKFRVGFWHSLRGNSVNWEANTDEILYEDDGINSLELKVLEAYPRDVGCGVARIDYSAAHAINVHWNRLDSKTLLGIQRGEILSGDTIEIKGRRRTVASVAPIILRDLGYGTVGNSSEMSLIKSLTTKQKKAKCFIRMDHFIRENAGVAIGDSVTVKKIEDWIMADAVSIAPINEIPPMDNQYFALALKNQPFILGQNFEIPFVANFQEIPLRFQMIGATPTNRTSGCYRVGEKTYFDIAV